VADHSSGSKLGSAYIEATVRLKDGKDQLKSQLEGYGDAARESGTKIGEELHKGILTAEPTAGALDAWAQSLQGKQQAALLKAFESGDVGAAGDQIAKAIADGSFKSFESGAAKDTTKQAATSFLGALGAGISSGIDEQTPELANSFRGKFLSSIADGLQSSGGIGTVLKTSFDNAKGTVEESAHNTADGFIKGFGERFKSGGAFEAVGITGALEGIKNGLSNIDIGDGLGKLKKNAHESAEALSAAGDETGVLAEKTGALAGAAELLADPYVLAGAAILGTVAALGIVFDKLDDLGEEWEKVTDTIIVETGGSTDQVAALGKQVEDIAGSTSAPLGQVASNVSDVSSLFNQTGDNVGKVAEEITKAQTVFGKFDTVGVSRAFDGFGITDADAQIAGLNDLAHGYQAARIPIDSMSAALERSAPAANQLGLNFHQTAGYLTEFAKSGVEPERASLSLTNALKNLQNVKVDKFLSGEGIDVDPKGKGLNAAFTTVLETIKELEAKGDDDSLAKAAAISDKVYGEGNRGGGPAVLQAEKPGIGQLDPTDLAKPLDGVKSSIDETHDATQHAAGAWAEFKHQVDVALKPAADAIHTFVDKTLTGLVQFFGAHQKEIAGFFSFIGEAAVRVGQVFALAFAAGISGAGLLALGIGEIIVGFANLVEAVGDGLQYLPTWLGGGKDNSDSVRHAADNIHNFANDVLGAGHTILDTSSTIGNFATGPMNQLATSVGAAGDNVKDTTGKVGDLATAFGNLNSGAPPKVDINTQDAQTKADQLITSLQTIATGGVPSGFTPPAISTGPIPGVPASVYGGLPQAPVGAPQNPLLIPYQPHADGGGIWGAGPKGKDTVPAMLAVGEHVWTADEVDAVGGQSEMYHLRAMAKAGLLNKGYAGGGGVETPVDPFTGGPISRGNYSSNAEFLQAWNLARLMGDANQAYAGSHHYEDGGAVGQDVAVADSLAGEPYSKGDRSDCSGMVGRVVEGVTGIGGPLPTTQTMQSFLESRGFKPGIGGAGQVSVGWYNHGSGENDGHAAMTLSNGENAESGPDNKFVVGGDAHGASASEFDQHMYLPQLWGEGSGAGNGLAGGVDNAPPSAAEVSSANDKVTSATDTANVAGQKLQEAKDKPLSANKKTGKLGKNAQADHDAAVAKAQEEFDAANRDVDTAKSNQANLNSGQTKGEVTAQNELADAKNRQIDAQAKLDAVNANPKAKPSDVTEAQNKLAEANTKVAEATTKVSDAQTKAEALKKPTKKDDQTNPVDAIGNIAGDFLKDNLPKGFTDPTSTPLFKEGSSLLKIIAGQVKDPTAKALLGAGAEGLGGSGSGVTQALAGLLPALKIPGLPGGLDGPVPPSDGNGATSNIDNSSTISGVGDMDAAKEVVGSVKADQTRSIRKLDSTGLTRVQ
jgi:hypothetical protein